MKYGRIDILEQVIKDMQAKTTKYRVKCDCDRLLELLKLCPVEEAIPVKKHETL